MTIRGHENIRVDYLTDDGTEQYDMDEYREAWVLGYGTDTNDDVDINDGTGGTTKHTMTLSDDEVEIYALQATDLDNDEIEVDTDLNAHAVIMRFRARYRPVDVDNQLLDFEIEGE